VLGRSTQTATSCGRLCLNYKDTRPALSEKICYTFRKILRLPQFGSLRRDFQAEAQIALRNKLLLWTGLKNISLMSKNGLPKTQIYQSFIFSTLTKRLRRTRTRFVTTSLESAQQKEWQNLIFNQYFLVKIKIVFRRI
jgi:hypothetical protein